jgi:hypothetical protein
MKGAAGLQDPNALNVKLSLCLRVWFSMLIRADASLFWFVPSIY